MSQPLSIPARDPTQRAVVVSFRYDAQIRYGSSITEVDVDGNLIVSFRAVSPNQSVCLHARAFARYGNVLLCKELCVSAIFYDIDASLQQYLSTLPSVLTSVSGKNNGNSFETSNGLVAFKYILLEAKFGVITYCMVRFDEPQDDEQRSEFETFHFNACPNLDDVLLLSWIYRQTRTAFPVKSESVYDKERAPTLPLGWKLTCYSRFAQQIAFGPLVTAHVARKQILDFCLDKFPKSLAPYNAIGSNYGYNCVPVHPHCKNVEFQWQNYIGANWTWRVLHARVLLFSISLVQVPTYIVLEILKFVDKYLLFASEPRVIQLVDNVKRSVHRLNLEKERVNLEKETKSSTSVANDRNAVTAVVSNAKFAASCVLF